MDKKQKLIRFISSQLNAVKDELEYLDEGQLRDILRLSEGILSKMSQKTPSVRYPYLLKNTQAGLPVIVKGVCPHNRDKVIIMAYPEFKERHYPIQNLSKAVWQVWTKDDILPAFREGDDDDPNMILMYHAMENTSGVPTNV